jgi:hypothetical protein
MDWLMAAPIQRPPHRFRQSPACHLSYEFGALAGAAVAGEQPPLPVHPREVKVSHNERDLRFPIIEWRGRRMANEDMRQVILLPDESGLRGVGPLRYQRAPVMTPAA